MIENPLQSVYSPVSDQYDGRNDVAVFLGWQDTARGEKVPLYNVIAKEHPLFGSTVSDRTLKEHHLPVPLPPRKSW